jgi:hypothetical protein
MSVRVNKASFSIREKLSELERPIGLKGSELMRSETAQEARDLVSAGRKNILINGAMQVWQRGTSVTGLTDGNGSTYLADRWLWGEGGSPSSVVTMSRDTDVPTGQGFAYSLKVSPTTADSSIDTNELQEFIQHIEAQNLQQLCYGTSNAKVSTLSFWVKCSQAGIANVWCYRADSTRSCTLQYTINQADTWQKIILTVPADTTGTIPNDNGSGMRFDFIFAAGSSFTGTGGNDGVWGATTNTGRANSQTINYLKTTSDYFQMTGIQYEIGRNATEFEHRSFSEELALCQRYYQKSYNYSQYPGAGTSSGSEWFTREGASGRIVTTTSFQVQMRTTPTFKLYDWAGNIDRVRTSSGNNQTITESYAHEKKITVGKTASISELLYQWYAEAEL